MNSMPMSAPYTPPQSDGLHQQNNAQETNTEVRTCEDYSTVDPTMELVDSQLHHLASEADEGLHLSKCMSDGMLTNCEEQFLESLTERPNMLQLREDNCSQSMAEQCEDVVISLSVHIVIVFLIPWSLIYL